MKGQWTQMSESASTMSPAFDHLFWFLIVLCAFTAFLIIGLLMVFTVLYRRRPGRMQAQATQRKKVIIEIIWIGLPLIIFLFLFVWGAKLYMGQMRIPPGSLPMYAVAQQWMWKFQHPEGRREINELHVPVGQPVSVTLISQDVIHSFFIPAFRIKMDVVPGRYTQTWFEAKKTGEYRIFCSQYCGTWHARMTGTLIVMTLKDYHTWAAQESDARMVFQGKKAVEHYGCLQCHREHSRVPSPLFKGLFGRQVHLTNGQVVTADEAYIRESILNPGRQVVEGYANVMPTFKHQLSEDDILNLIEYIKSLSISKA